MEEMLAFLAARYDDDEQFARGLVSVSDLPPTAYALGVAFAQRLVADVATGRALIVSCRPAAHERAEVTELKAAVVRDLVRSHQDHSEFQPSWLT